MALGDVIIELKVPPMPAGAQETHKQYVDKVKKTASVHFQGNGIEPPRYAWIGRYDIPEDPAEVPALVEEFLADSTINLGDYTFSLGETGGDTLYCVSSGFMECYSSVIATPDTSAPNDFEFTVNLSGGESVDVPFHFVVRWRQSFPVESVSP